MTKEISEETIEILKTQLRHLKNDLMLTKKEYEISTSNFLEAQNELKIKNTELQKYQENLEKIIESKKEELLKSEMRFRKLAQTSKDAFVIFDRNESIVFWNEGAREIFGYDEKEIIMKSFQCLISKKSRTCVINIINKMTSNKNSHKFDKNFEIIGTCKNGEEFPIDVSMSSWKEGRERYVAGIMRDISEKKQQEDEFIRKEKLNAVIEMAGATSHELNQPMQVILGFTSFLLSEYTLDSYTKKRMNTIKNQIAKMAKITKQIQNITKYKTKKYLNGSIIDIENSSREDEKINLDM